MNIFIILIISLLSMNLVCCSQTNKALKEDNFAFPGCGVESTTTNIVTNNSTIKPSKYLRPLRSNETSSYPEIKFSSDACKYSEHTTCHFCCNDVCCPDVMQLPAQSEAFLAHYQMWIPVRFVTILEVGAKNWATMQWILYQLPLLNNEFKRMGLPMRYYFESVEVHNDNTLFSVCQNPNKQPCEYRKNILFDKFVKKSSKEIVIFLCDGKDKAGLATYPWSTYGEDSKFNYIILYSVTILPNEKASKIYEYSLPKTLIHESGHYFGLMHPFEKRDTCEGRGDFTEDTPARLTAGEGLAKCDADLDSCPNQWGKDLVNNYMDYFNQICRTAFTPGQIERVIQSILVFRPKLKANTLVISANADCKENMTHISNCTCGDDNFCSPELLCRASNNPKCQGPEANTTYLYECTCPQIASNSAFVAITTVGVIAGLGAVSFIGYASYYHFFMQ